MHTEARQAELKAAFERVENKSNWKLPIDATIELENPIQDAILISDAVIHFAGCVPTIWHMEGNKYRVVAIGYYAAVGA